MWIMSLRGRNDWLSITQWLKLELYNWRCQQPYLCFLPVEHKHHADCNVHGKEIAKETFRECGGFGCLVHHPSLEPGPVHGHRGWLVSGADSSTQFKWYLCPSLSIYEPQCIIYDGFWLYLTQIVAVSFKWVDTIRSTWYSAWHIESA